VTWGEVSTTRPAGCANDTEAVKSRNGARLFCVR
jgi:hypothetical protein